MLASMVGEPERVTPALMDRWAKSFENWAVCDTATFVLWDRTPHAWSKVREWSGRDEEFVKRAAFAMLASLTVHDKQAPDEKFLEGLVLIEREASDGRNFVKKAVNWALRSIGKRSPALNRAAVSVARRLADSQDPASRWIGKDALREITSPAVARRIAAREDGAGGTGAARVFNSRTIARQRRLDDSWNRSDPPLSNTSRSMPIGLVSRRHGVVRPALPQFTEPWQPAEWCPLVRRIARLDEGAAHWVAQDRGDAVDRPLPCRAMQCGASRRTGSAGN
jgi:hypothetical protein